MREPRRFPRPSRHVTPSQKASSPEKLTRPISQKSAPSPRLAVERLRPQSRKAHIRHHSKERAALCGPRSNGCVHKSGKHVAKNQCNRIHKAGKHVALQKNTHSPSPKGARRPAARGRTVASTNQENMSRKSPATATATFAFTKQKNMSPFRKTYIRHPPKERAAPAPRGRTVASTNQENMSRKSPATASTKQKNMSPFRKAHIRHPPKGARRFMRPAVERLRPQIRKTCREKPMQPKPP